MKLALVLCQTRPLASPILGGLGASSIHLIELELALQYVLAFIVFVDIWYVYLLLDIVAACMYDNVEMRIPACGSVA